MINTRETDYALRIVRALDPVKTMPTQLICENEQIPLKFAYKIISKLDKAQWIEVLRGANGGCRLKIDLDSKTILDLMAAMGRKPLISPCLAEDYECEWKIEHQCTCTVNEEFARLQHGLEESMQKYTIQEILNQADSAQL
ncbi:MAG: Rrf2 family transcriptional regulator [Erysipelotrichaceae bacterium]|nr:Rrf2 family transcriptional regulator [Erysipelotrichaceae bacterium]